MFCQNITFNIITDPMIPKVINNHFNSKSKHSKLTKKFETRLNRQKDCRYRMLIRRRFRQRIIAPSEVWGEDIGYQSEDSDNSYSSSDSSVTGFETMTQNDILTAFLDYGQQNELILNKMVANILSQLNALYNDWNALEQVIQPLTSILFDRRVLDKVTMLIGAKGVRQSLQIKILDLFEECLDKYQLNKQLIENVINSSFIWTLIDIVRTGHLPLLERSLRVIVLLAERNDSTELLLKILNSGLIDQMYERTEMLRWKTNKVNSLDHRMNRRQLKSENSSSFAAKLFREFSRAIYRLLGINMNDTLLMDLFTTTTPLIARFLGCPDFTVTSTAIDCLQGLAKNQTICSSIVQKFDLILYAMTDKSDEKIIISLVQLFNSLSAYPIVFGHKNFGINLMMCLEKVMSQKRKSHTLDKEVIETIGNITELVMNNAEALSQLSDRLINLSLIVFYSYDRYNRVIAIQIIETILSKSSFECLAKLFVVLDLNKLLTDLMTSDDRHQRIALKITDSIIDNVINHMIVIPEEAETFKKSVFGKNSDIYYCLEKLSFKTCNEFVSNRANHLLKQIDGKRINDEDLALLPKVSQNGFVFGLNFESKDCY